MKTPSTSFDKRKHFYCLALFIISIYIFDSKMILLAFKLNYDWITTSEKKPQSSGGQQTLSSFSSSSSSWLFNLSVNATIPSHTDSYNASNIKISNDVTEITMWQSNDLSNKMATSTKNSEANASTNHSINKMRQKNDKKMRRHRTNREEKKKQNEQKVLESELKKQKRLERKQKRLERKQTEQKILEDEQKSFYSELDPDNPLLPFKSCDGLNFSAPVLCGVKKCFVEVNEHPNIGYLVSNSHSFDRMVQGYNYAKYLIETYKIKHFLLDEPRRLPVFLPCLYRQLETHARYHVDPESNITRSYTFLPYPIIQKCEIAPTPHLIFGRRGIRKDYFYEMLEPFITSHVPNRTQFADHLELEIKYTLMMLRHEPCLLQDFQVLLDAHGDLHHIDLDRCFENDASDSGGTVDQIQIALQDILIQVRSVM